MGYNLISLLWLENSVVIFMLNFLALAESSYENTARGILYVIYELIWKLMYYVLILIDEVSKLFYKVAGINVKDGVVQNKNIFDQLLKDSVISGWYGVFILIAVALVCVFTMAGVLKGVLSSDEKRSISPILKNTGLALLLLIVVGPVSVFLISVISNISIIVASIGGNNNLSISDIIFNNSGNLITVYNETFATSFVSFRELGNDFLYELMYHPKEGITQLSFYSYITLLGGGFILYNLIRMTIDVIKRIFNIVLLYIAAPFAISKMSLDDGKSFKEWQNRFFYEIVLLFTQMGTFMIFIALVNILSNIDFEASAVTEGDDSLLDSGLYEPEVGEETTPVVESFSLLNGLGRTLIMMAAASVTRTSATMLADVLKGKETKTDNLLESLLTKISSRVGQPVTRTRTITRNTATTKRETVFVQANELGNRKFDSGNTNSRNNLSANTSTVNVSNNFNQSVNVSNQLSNNNTFNNRTIKEGVTKGSYASERVSPGAIFIGASKSSSPASQGETFKVLEQSTAKEAANAMQAYAKANASFNSAVQSGDSGKLQQSLAEYTKAYAKEADVLSDSYRKFETQAQDSMKSALSTQAKQELTNISNAYRKAQIDYNKTAAKLKEYDGERISTADALRIKEQADKQRERLMNASNRAAQFYNNQKKEEE